MRLCGWCGVCGGCLVVWLCGCVVVWLCGCVVVWLCGCVVVWLCGCVVVWLCGCVVVWLCGGCVGWLWVGEWRLVGQGLHHTSFTCTIHHSQHQRIFLFPSLLGPVVGEMPSAARFAAVGMVGRPLHHVVRDAFCEGDEGIAEVREQLKYPPTASAVRECGGNVVGDHAVSLEIMQILTSTIRAIYLPCVQCGRTLHRECCILASL